MAKYSKDLRDEEIVRFLRFSVRESAPGTFTQQSFDTNLSIDRGLIWLIHWVEYDLSTSHLTDDPAAGAEESISLQITRESKSTILGYSDSDLVVRKIIFWKHAATIGTEAGPMWVVDSSPKMQTFPIPLPYAGQTIYIAAQSTCTAAATGQGRLAYTLRRVTDKFFYRVAQALIS